MNRRLTFLLLCGLLALCSAAGRAQLQVRSGPTNLLAGRTELGYFLLINESATKPLTVLNYQLPVPSAPGITVRENFYNEIKFATSGTFTIPPCRSLFLEMEIAAAPGQYVNRVYEQSLSVDYVQGGKYRTSSGLYGIQIGLPDVWLTLREPELSLSVPKSSTDTLLRQVRAKLYNGTNSVVHVVSYHTPMLSNLFAGLSYTDDATGQTRSAFQCRQVSVGAGATIGWNAVDITLDDTSEPGWYTSPMVGSNAPCLIEAFYFPPGAAFAYRAAVSEPLTVLLSP